ncbi:MAG: NupC/NupG family nucleoside CNT transporter [Planctomycetota bacterium]
MLRAVSLLGLATWIALAWLMSENRWKVSLRTVAGGLGLQFLVGMLLLWSAPGRRVFETARDLIDRVVGFSDGAAAQVFGESSLRQGFAVSLLASIVFLSSLMAVLAHLGVLQWLVRGMAVVMERLMNTSGTESLAAAANVFLGMTTAPLVIRPYLDTLTRSEIMAVMTGGMATIAANMMGIYAGLGIDAGHILTASLMSAPAALMISKIMVPETETSVTRGKTHVRIPRQDTNLFDAACRGASEGIQLSINVLAMLIALIAIVAMLNWVLSALPPVWGGPLTLERMLGWACCPIAWLLGIEWRDAQSVGMLIGQKTILNEMIAYIHLAELSGNISDRSMTIATYALCGFANLGSLAIMIGGVGALVPERRADFARYGLRSLIAGTLAAFCTASVAGLLL